MSMSRSLPDPTVARPALMSPQSPIFSEQASSRRVPSISLSDTDLPEDNLKSPPDEQQRLLTSSYAASGKRYKPRLNSSLRPSILLDDAFVESKETDTEFFEGEMSQQRLFARQFSPREAGLFSEESTTRNVLLKDLQDQQCPDIDRPFDLKQWKKKYMPIAHKLITYAKQKKHSELWRLFDVLLGPEHLKVKREIAEQLFAIERALIVVKCNLVICEHLKRIVELEDASHCCRMLYEAAVAHQNELLWANANTWGAALSSWIFSENLPLPDVDKSLRKHYDEVCQSITDGDFDIDNHLAFVNLCHQQRDILWKLSAREGECNLDVFHRDPRSKATKKAIDRHLKKRIEECIPSVMDQHAKLIDECAQQAHQITSTLSIRVAKKHVKEALKEYVLTHIEAFSKQIFQETDSKKQKFPETWLKKWHAIKATLIQEEHLLIERRETLEQDMQAKLLKTTHQYKEEALEALRQYVPRDNAELKSLWNHPERVMQEILECDIGNMAQSSITISSTKKTLLMYCIDEIEAALEMSGYSKQRRLMYCVQILKTLCMHGAVALTAVDGKLPSLEDKTPMAILVDNIIKMTQSPTSNLKDTHELTLQLYELLEKTFLSIPALSELAAYIRDFYYEHTHALCLATEAITIQGEGTWIQQLNLKHKNKQLACLARGATDLAYASAGTDETAMQTVKLVASGKTVPTRWYELRSDLQKDAARKIKRLECSNRLIFSLLGAGYNEVQRLASAQDAQAEKIGALEEKNEQLEQENQEIKQQLAKLTQAVTQIQNDHQSSESGNRHGRSSFATANGMFAADGEDSIPLSAAAAQPTGRRLSSAEAD